MMHKLFLAALVLALVTFAVPNASAAIGDTETIQLNVDFCTNACFTGASGGSVTKTVVAATGTETGNDVEIDVALTGGLNFHNTNAFDVFAFNYVGGTGTLSATFLTPPPAGTFTLQGPGSFHEDGAQTFNYSVGCTSLCASNITGITSLKFIVSNSTNTDLTLAQLDSTNGGASVVDFAAAVTTTGLSTNCTGVIGGGDHAASNTTGGICQSNTAVPEPTAVLLLGTALFFTGKLIKTKLVA